MEIHLVMTMDISKVKQKAMHSETMMVLRLVNYLVQHLGMPTEKYLVTMMAMHLGMLKATNLVKLKAISMAKSLGILMAMTMETTMVKSSVTN